MLRLQAAQLGKVPEEFPADGVVIPAADVINELARRRKGFRRLRLRGFALEEGPDCFADVHPLPLKQFEIQVKPARELANAFGNRCGGEIAAGVGHAP